MFTAVTSQLPVVDAVGCTALAVPGGTCLSYRVAWKGQLHLAALSVCWTAVVLGPSCFCVCLSAGLRLFWDRRGFGSVCLSVGRLLFWDRLAFVSVCLLDCCCFGTVLLLCLSVCWTAVVLGPSCLLSVCLSVCWTALVLGPSCFCVCLSVCWTAVVLGPSCFLSVCLLDCCCFGTFLISVCLSDCLFFWPLPSKW
jgi:hypothetical protein